MTVKSTWPDFFKKLETHLLHIPSVKGYHGIATLVKNLEEIISLSGKELKETYSKDNLVILPNINIRHIILFRRIDYFIFHDAIMYKYLPGWKVVILKFLQGLAISRARTVICISEYARSELVKFHAVSEDKILIIPNVVNIHFDKNFFIWVGSPKKHKQPEMINQIANELRVPIVAVGLTNDDAWSPFLQPVKNLPPVAYYSLLNSARALIVTSEDEGFHLPSMEALKMGTNVLGLQLEVLKENYGEAVNLFESLEDLIQALQCYK